MNQQEHLKRIRARCVELLSLAEKRTQGRWNGYTRQTDGDLPAGTLFVVDENMTMAVCAVSPPPVTKGDQNNAAFITSCAGSAEAGWKATITAIDLMFAMHGLAEIDIYALDATGDILAAWPEELL
jgi:hypothetical protein